MFSMPCRSDGDGDYEVIDDFMVDDWLRMKLKVCVVRWWWAGGGCGAGGAGGGRGGAAAAAAAVGQAGFCIK